MNARLRELRRRVVRHWTACAASRLVALLLLTITFAPYAAYAQELFAAEERPNCGMPCCKRSGECCCRKSAKPKPVVHRDGLRWSAEPRCSGGCDSAPAVRGINVPALLDTHEQQTAVAAVASVPVRRSSAQCLSAVEHSLFERPPPFSLQLV